MKPFILILEEYFMKLPESPWAAAWYLSSRLVKNEPLGMGVRSEEFNLRWVPEKSPER